MCAMVMRDHPQLTDRATNHSTHHSINRYTDHFTDRASDHSNDHSTSPAWDAEPISTTKPQKTTLGGKADPSKQLDACAIHITGQLNLASPSTTMMAGVGHDHCDGQDNDHNL